MPRTPGASPGGLGVVAVQLLQRRRPVFGPGHAPRELAQLRAQPLVLLTPTLAKGARVERDVLFLAQEPAVTGLAESEVAGGAAPKPLEKRGELVESRRRARPRLGEGAAELGLSRFGREQVPEVPRAGTRLAERAVDQNRRDEIGGEIVTAVTKRLGHRPEARHRRVDERGLGAQAVEEQPKHALEAGPT